MRRVYLDHNATTPVDPEVLDAMLPYFGQEFGNASSIHSYGQRTRKAVELARDAVAQLLGARATEIVFTSGGTESDNLAIFGVIAAAQKENPGKPLHVITSRIEHSAVRNTCEALQARGVEATFVPVTRDGLLDPQEIKRAIRPDTILVSVMHANNELGTIQPVQEIARIAAEADVYFHTDAVQSAGKIHINVDELGVDLLAISGHKIHAPKGVGALYVRKGTKIEQVMFGGHHERDRRPGTENVAGIVGLGAAASAARQRLEQGSGNLAVLRDKLEKGILANVPHARVNGQKSPRTPNTSNITFGFVEGEPLVIALDMKGIACSTGAACSSGAVAPSPVLTAIGLPKEEARATLRFSLGHANTEEDVDYALSVIPATIEHLRELSPLYRKPVAVS
ncbi:MAG: cysteine desulfurase NifS [Acidobacteria bacterium]|nr:cysteine desulfurase NifS [Acidobacteriota bacterium]